jgi:hypothetical protein
MPEKIVYYVNWNSRLKFKIKANVTCLTFSRVQVPVAIFREP